MLYGRPRTNGVGRRHRGTVLGWMVLVISLVVGPAAAQEADGPCEEALAVAEAAYRNAEFDDAIRLLSPCLDRDDVPEAQAVRAYRLLSLTHLQRDELPEARAAIVRIFSLRPEYEADPIEDPPSYVSLVSIVRRDVQPTAAADDETEEARRTPFFRRTSTWVSVASTLVVGGVVSLFVLGSSGDDDGNGGGGNGGDPDPLPDPPGTPSGH